VLQYMRVTKEMSIVYSAKLLLYGRSKQSIIKLINTDRFREVVAEKNKF